MQTDNDDPRSWPTVVVGGIGVLLFVVILLGLEALYGSAREEEELRKVVDRVSPRLELLRERQRLQMSEYRWVDRDSGTVAIPIERAMELIARESGSSAGAPAGSR
jgi:hypothetical protein